MTRKRIWLAIAAAIVAPIVVFAGVAQSQGTSALATWDCNSQGSSGLQNAENSLATGGTLIVSGTCGTSSSPISLTVNARTTLQGTMQGAIINGTVIYNSPAPATIRGIQASCSSSTEACIQIQNGFRVTLEDISVTGGANGIEFTAPSCGKGSGCNVEDVVDHANVQGAQGNGIFINDGANTITDGYVINSQVGGGQVGIEDPNAAGWHIVDNHVYANSVVGIFAKRMYGSVVQGNDIEDSNGIQAILQTNSEPSTISENMVKAGAISITTLGTPCYVTAVGNVSTSLSTPSSCTVGTAANLTN